MERGDEMRRRSKSVAWRRWRLKYGVVAPHIGERTRDRLAKVQEPLEVPQMAAVPPLLMQVLPFWALATVW